MFQNKYLVEYILSYIEPQPDHLNNLKNVSSTFREIIEDLYDDGEFIDFNNLNKYRWNRTFEKPLKLEDPEQLYDLGQGTIISISGGRYDDCLNDNHLKFMINHTWDQLGDELIYGAPVDESGKIQKNYSPGEICIFDPESDDDQDAEIYLIQLSEKPPKKYLDIVDQDLFDRIKSGEIEADICDDRRDQGFGSSSLDYVIFEDGRAVFDTPGNSPVCLEREEYHQLLSKLQSH